MNQKLHKLLSLPDYIVAVCRELGKITNALDRMSTAYDRQWKTRAPTILFQGWQLDDDDRLHAVTKWAIPLDRRAISPFQVVSFDAVHSCDMWSVEVLAGNVTFRRVMRNGMSLLDSTGDHSCVQFFESKERLEVGSKLIFDVECPDLEVVL